MKNLSILFIVLSIVSLIIAIYQFTVNHFFEGIMSLVYSTTFLIGGIFNKRKHENNNPKKTNK